MTVFKKATDSNNQNLKIMPSALIVLASFALFACGQSNTSVATTNVNADAAKTVSVEQSAAVQAPAIVQPTVNKDLLKNVSATVYKDANCGCCKEWIGHAEDNGLNATGQDVEDMSIFKERYGVPNEMRSCHTAVTTDGYVFEGHVPAKYVAEFLANPPAQALGLAVPGMPMGSPGMEYQNKFDPYQIMQMNKDGSSEVYASIDTIEQQL